MRLDVYLATYWPEYSRSQWQKFCKDGHVSVNGEVVIDPAYSLGEDDEVQTTPPAVEDHSEKTLPVVYEDDNVIVINKPAGILTHAKGAPLNEFTVAEFMRFRTSDKPESNRPGIVHRLDRDTSGIIICAKNPEAHSHLQRQFSDRKVKKLYHALLESTPKELIAIIRLPLERNPKRPQTFRVGANGKPAETHYKVQSELKDNACLVELKPLTGRTHQLRVHMEYLGCPIIGDKLYGNGKESLRMYLHASQLEITIPGGERRVFEAPLPSEFTDYIKTHG